MHIIEPIFRSIVPAQLENWALTGERCERHKSADWNQTVAPGGKVLRPGKGGHRTSSAIVVICAAAMLLQACSLVNPHVTWTRDGLGGFDPAGNKGTLENGITYANRAKDAYKVALGEQASFNSLLGIGLIPLSAAAIGLGIHQVSGEAVTALGLTGAAALGTGTWLTSKPRRFAYIAGMEGLTCAIDAMLPLNFAAQEYRNFSEDLTGTDRPGRESLATAIATTKEKIAAVKALAKVFRAATADDHPLAQRADADVQTSETIVVTAEDALTKGTILRRQLSSADQTLMNGVDRIGAKVDDLVLQTQPSIESLQQIVSGLAQTSISITKVPESLKSPEEMGGTEAPQDGPQAAGPGEDLQTALGELKSATQTLESASLRVSSVVNSVNTKRPVETLKNCGVKVPEEIATLKITPATDVQFVEGADTVVRRFVTGGKKPYSADLSQASTSVLTAKVLPQSSWLEIAATKDLKAGNYEAVVIDSADHAKVVAIKVTAKTSNNQGQSNNTGQNQRPTALSGEALKNALTKLVDQFKAEDFTVSINDVNITVKKPGKVSPDGTKALIELIVPSRASKKTDLNSIKDLIVEQARVEGVKRDSIEITNIDEIRANLLL